MIVRMEDATHFVVQSSPGIVMVKEAEFFKSQGGFNLPWGQRWTPVRAASIGDARRKAAKEWGFELSRIYDGEA